MLLSKKLSKGYLYMHRWNSVQVCVCVCAGVCVCVCVCESSPGLQA